MQETHATHREDDHELSTRRRSFDVYLDDAGGYDLMSAADEQALSRRIIALRRAYWRQLLAVPTFVPMVCDELEARGPAELQRSAGAVRETVRAFGHGKDVASAEALSAALEALAEQAAAWDLHTHYADALTRALAERLENADAPPDGATDMLRRHVLRLQRISHRLKSTRNRFVCANLRLVVRIAQRYGRNRLSLADRVQEGNLGLMKAVDRFDPDRGVRFSTYAAWWIRHAVTRALVNRGRTVRIPAHLHTVFTKAAGARRSLRGQLGREPTVQELAAVINETPDKVERAQRAMELRSIGLEAPLGGDDSPQVIDSLEDEMPEDWDTRLDDRRNSHLAVAALETLDPIEVDVLTHRFGLGGAPRLTLQRIGEKYSLSRERIRQLQNRALAKLRRIIETSEVPTLRFA